jgi:hypothetical protein
MAAEIKGTLRVIRRLIREEVSISGGAMSDAPGVSRTSS